MSETDGHHWHGGNGGRRRALRPRPGRSLRSRCPPSRPRKPRRPGRRPRLTCWRPWAWSSADDLKAALDGFKAQFQESQKSAEQKAAELASQVDTFKSQAETYKATVQGLLDAEVAAIPEDKRSIVPDFGDPAKSLAWIASNRALIGSGRPPPRWSMSGLATAPERRERISTVTMEQFGKMSPGERMQFYADFPEQAADMSAKFAATIAT
jgi:hypothetical protein